MNQVSFWFGNYFVIPIGMVKRLQKREDSYNYLKTQGDNVGDTNATLCFRDD
jgi:hypothetical protein